MELHWRKHLQKNGIKGICQDLDAEISAKAEISTLPASPGGVLSSVGGRLSVPVQTTGASGYQPSFVHEFVRG